MRVAALISKFPANPRLELNSSSCHTRLHLDAGALSIQERGKEKNTL